ncbi:hypothetical protein D3C78_972030 [compost metagenome]
MLSCALNSVNTLRHFQALTSKMSVVEYDLKTIVSDVINHLHDSNNMNTLNAYIESYRELDHREGGSGFDGSIMVEALQSLANGLQQCFRQMKLYDETGKLHYRFQALVSQTVMVMATK